VAVSEIPQPFLQGALGPAATTVRVEPDLDALIGAEDVELVSLCSPRRDEQFRHAVRCLEAGKHVLAERSCAR